MGKGNNEGEETSISSVGLAVPNFLTVTNSPLISDGTINISLNHNPLPISSGGTGMTSLGSKGQVLSVLSTDPEQIGWTNVEGTGTVTSVSLSTPDYIKVFPSTITSSGTFEISVDKIPVENGGTGLTNLGQPGQVLLVSSAGTDLEYSTLNNGVTKVSLTTSTPFLSTSSEPVTSQGSLEINCTTIPVSCGGTGLTSVGWPGQYLSVDENSNLQYTTPDSGVISVSLTTPEFLSVTPSTITKSGTFDISLSSKPLPVTNGGTGLLSLGTPGQILSVSGTGDGLEYSTPNNGVTSVSLVTSTPFLSISSEPVTSEGSLNINCSTIPVSHGGTGLTSPGLPSQILASNGSGLEWIDKPILDNFITSINVVSPFVCSSGPTPTISVGEYTGSGKLCFDNSPILTTPVLGAATASSLTIIGSQSGSIKISAMAGTYNLTLPTTAGQNNQVLTSQGPFNPCVWAKSEGTGSLVRSTNSTLSGQTSFVNGNILCQSKFIQSQGLITITSDLKLSVDQFCSFLIIDSEDAITISIPSAQEFQDSMKDFTVGNRISTFCYNKCPKLSIRVSEDTILIDDRTSSFIHEYIFVLTNSGQGILLIK